MSKPPQAPPASDIDGVHQDRRDQRSAKSFDAKAQAQLDAEKKEALGRPRRSRADKARTIPTLPEQKKNGEFKMDKSKYPEAKLWDMVEDIRVAMLTTHRGNRLESRPMHAYFDRNARCLWFLTELGSEKTVEIAEGEAVNLAFVDKNDQSYISMSGHARVVRDVAKQKQLWNAFAEAWMPEGPEAPNVGLIRVDPVEATYWDSPSSKLAMLWEVAKANVTQTPPDNSDVRKVSLG